MLAKAINRHIGQAFVIVMVVYTDMPLLSVSPVSISFSSMVRWGCIYAIVHTDGGRPYARRRIVSKRVKIGKPNLASHADFLDSHITTS